MKSLDVSFCTQQSGSLVFFIFLTKFPEIVTKYKLTKKIEEYGESTDSCVFSHTKLLPYLRGMEAVFDLSLPTSWEELTDKQLLMVYGLFARKLSAAEVKTLCLIKWNKLTILARLRKHKYLVQRNRSQVIVTSKQIQQATCFLDFLDSFAPLPVRLKRIGHHRALPADFEKVPFEKYLYLENLFQGVLHTQEPASFAEISSQAHELLLQMAQVLYDSDRLKPDTAELASVFYWFASLKQYFAQMFPHFYAPVGATDGNQLGGSLFAQLRETTNAQIRALTGGDITKEALIRQMDTHRALTELDAKAREAEEFRNSERRAKMI